MATDQCPAAKNINNGHVNTHIVGYGA